MEADLFSETLDFNSELMWLISWVYFVKFIRREIFSVFSGYVRWT